MVKMIRRLVTGHDANGKAVCVSDADAGNIHQGASRSGVVLTNLWATDATPAAIDGPEETVDGPLNLEPPADGSVFRIVEFAPEDADALAQVDARAAFAEMGAEDAVIAGARHPFMHRTKTVDYAIILEGEITMLLDDTEHHLTAGDVVVQRGTNHAWSNRGETPCRIAFILLDGARD